MVTCAKALGLLSAVSGAAGTCLLYRAMGKSW